MNDCVKLIAQGMEQASKTELRCARRRVGVEYVRSIGITSRTKPESMGAWGMKIQIRSWPIFLGFWLQLAQPASSAREYRRNVFPLHPSHIPSAIWQPKDSL